MASASYELDAESLDRVMAAMETYGTRSGQVVKEYLDKEAPDKITEHIQPLIHPSGRTWKGKATSATEASRSTVFSHVMKDSLSVEIDSTGKYHYLYFPDDGSNTKKHFGNQEFMRRGAEAASPEITDEIVSRLAAAFMEE